MKEWLKPGVVVIVLFLLVTALFAYGFHNNQLNLENTLNNNETEFYDQAEASEPPKEILSTALEFKDVVFQGSRYENGAYCTEDKIYLDSEIIAKGYGFSAMYNADEDYVEISKPANVSYDHVRYTIIDDEYWFYSETLGFVAFDEELVNTRDLAEKGIAVNINHRNTRSSNWDPSYVTDFVFVYNNVSYAISGKPLVELTIDEDYYIERPDVDVTNLAWRIVENGNVVLERNAQNEYRYRYFGNTSGNTYEVSLISYFDGYEEISNVLTYTIP